jgi:starch synthase
MNILMISAEMAPFAKVGGLGDVVDALARALADRRHDVRVVLPLYGHLDRNREKIVPIRSLPPLAVRVGQQMYGVRLYRRGSARAAVKVYLIECEELFGQAGIYTDAEGAVLGQGLARAALHGQVAVMLPRLLDWPVDVLHVHDAEAVPGLLYRRQWYAGQGLPGSAGTVLTIHNLAHQEVHPPGGTETLGLPGSLAVYPGLLEFHGQVNLLKAGILAADQVNTVSPGYARETRTLPGFGCGLEEMLASRGEDYSGILNGADYGTWDPARDRHLPAPYTPSDLSGKAVCRSKLCKELMLTPGAAASPPLCGFVGRLVGQKGVDLLLPLLDRLAGDGFTFAILGTGEPRLHLAVEAVAARHPGRVAFCQQFDEALAHRIYAGSDLFLMPSAFEPCGLSQMYALKYGTPPVVRLTGGLADTVTDAADPDGTGFVFAAARPEALMDAMRRAEKLRRDGPAWRQLQLRGMARDFSWQEAAAAYEVVYTRATRNETR